MRLTWEEVSQLRNILSSVSGIPAQRIRYRESKYGFHGIFVLEKDFQDEAVLELPHHVPDIPRGETGAAEKMLVFMGLAEHPTRTAEFWDYTALAYEFAKKHRHVHT